MIEATQPEQIEILTDDQKAVVAKARRQQEPGPDIAL
jgi:hypothetical protein